MNVPQQPTFMHHTCIGEHQNTQPYKQTWEGEELSSDCPLYTGFSLSPYTCTRQKAVIMLPSGISTKPLPKEPKTLFKGPKQAFSCFLLQYSQHSSSQRHRERGLGAGKVLENRPTLSPTKGKVPMTSTAQHSTRHTAHTC